MRIMVVGGTGFLGYYSVLAARARGIECGALAYDDVSLQGWFPSDVPVTFGDVFKMTEEELVPLLQGWDALIYSVGPDDRVTPPAPAYDFFHERLVNAVRKVFAAARKAGIKRAVIFNSYFAYFDRLYPEKKLAEKHPYIRCRNEQAEAVFAEGQGQMDVMVLELPYIFGCMPNRVPLWKTVFIDRFMTGPVVFFPRGGTTMIHVRHIGEAAVGALLHGEAGTRYPIGDENHSFRQMLLWFEEGLGISKPICLVNKYLCAWGADLLEKADARKGLQPGLYYKYLMKDIMDEQIYIPDAVIDEVSQKLHYGRGGVREGILEAMRACYPDGFQHRKKKA